MSQDEIFIRKICGKKFLWLIATEKESSFTEEQFKELLIDINVLLEKEPLVFFLDDKLINKVINYIRLYSKQDNKLIYEVINKLKGLKLTIYSSKERLLYNYREYQQNSRKLKFSSLEEILETSAYDYDIFKLILNEEVDKLDWGVLYSFCNYMIVEIPEVFLNKNILNLIIERLSNIKVYEIRKKEKVRQLIKAIKKVEA